MGAFFSSLGRTITAGVVLLIIIVLAVGGLTEAACAAAIYLSCAGCT